jgi:hypothetical protein
MSGTHGLLQPNQPGYFYTTLEESYVTLFKISADKWFEQHKSEADAEKERNARSAHAVAKAYITDVLVHLSNDLYKATQSEKSLWVFLSFPQLESRLHGGVKMRTLKDAMKEMIDDGYVFKRPNRDPRYKALEYRLNLPKFRKELEALPSKLDKDESANLHDGIDDAKLHDDSAKLHDDSANLHPRRNIDLTKKKQIQKEREKEPTQQKATVSTQDDSHSFAPSSFLSSSSETKAEVVFSQEEEAVYTLAERLDLVYLKRDEKHKESCAKLVAKGVVTLEKMESLIAHCKQVPFLQGKTLNLKNLVNELSGWSQLHRPEPKKVYTVGEMHLRPFRDQAAESLAKQEEVKARIQKQEAEQGRPQMTLKERVAAQKQREKFLKGKAEYEAALARGENPY